MGFWLRFRIGPFGYTTRPGRKRQSYREYKAARQRREEYAFRYEAERTAREKRITPESATRIRGCTDSKFDGIGDKTLRRWLIYWREVAEGRREPALGDRPDMAEAEAAKITAELEARRFQT